MDRNTFLDRIEKLSGEDKEQMIDQANSFQELSNLCCNTIFLMNKTALTMLIQEESPTFNPETDYIFVSNEQETNVSFR
jgi:hypothetical protein